MLYVLKSILLTGAAYILETLSKISVMTSFDFAFMKKWSFDQLLNNVTSVLTSQ